MFPQTSLEMFSASFAFATFQNVCAYIKFKKLAFYGVTKGNDTSVPPSA